MYYNFKRFFVSYNYIKFYLVIIIKGLFLNFVEMKISSHDESRRVFI